VKLIVVDDYPLEGRTIEYLLKRNRPNIQYCGQALSGQAGLDLAIRISPDIAIVDVQMPEIDGLSLTKKLREHQPNTSVVILTAYDKFSYIQTALRAGVADYLLKPINSEDFFEVLSRVERQQMSKDSFTVPLDSQQPLPEISHEFISKVCTGDSAGIMSLFNSFWEQNYQENGGVFNDALSMAKWFALQILQGLGEQDDDSVIREAEAFGYCYYLFLKQIADVRNSAAVRECLIEYVQNLANIFNKNLYKSGYEQIAHAKKIIEANLHQEITLEMVAHEVYITTYYLSRLFKQLTGTNFSTYIINQRIEKSKHLLVTTNDTIEKIADAVGYAESNSFRRLFKKVVGVPPTEYRKIKQNYISRNK